jgi:hypothetical protein
MNKVAYKCTKTQIVPRKCNHDGMRRRRQNLRLWLAGVAALSAMKLLAVDQFPICASTKHGAHKVVGNPVANIYLQAFRRVQKETRHPVFPGEYQGFLSLTLPLFTAGIQACYFDCNDSMYFLTAVMCIPPIVSRELTSPLWSDPNRGPQIGISEVPWAGTSTPNRMTETK